MKTQNYYTYSSKWFTAAVALLFGAYCLQAQLPVYESFTYATGNLSGKGAWATSVATIQVATGSLDGTALGLNDSAGNKVTVTGGATGFNSGTKEDFVAADITSGSVYFSFLVKLNDATGIDTGGTGTPILHFNQRGSGTKTAVSILLYNNAGHVEIGIGRHTGSATIATSGFTAADSGSAIEDGSTYLVVGKYQFNAGNTNDTVSLWVNPASLNTVNEDASPKVNAIGAGNTDSAGIGRVYVAQGVDASIDELRIGATWADVTPSVTCNAASINSDPTNQTAYIDGTGSFAVTANGTGPTYHWQLSTDGGSNWNNAPGTANNATYTTPMLAINDNGNKYRCIVSVGCGGGSSVTSSVASLTVTDPTGFSFRTVTSGNWNDATTWEQSTNGNIWFPASSTPVYLNSSITVKAGHTVTVTAPVVVDDLTIEAGGAVNVSGAMFTINDGAAAVDCTVLGYLQVSDVASSGITIDGNAGLNMADGSHYTWSSSSGTATIPIASWNDGSTCEIQSCSNNTPVGLAQSFYDFRWSRTTAGQLNLAGQLTTVRHDLIINASPSQVNSMRFMATAGIVDLFVGNDLILESGSTTLSGGSVAGTVLNVHIGRNLVINNGAQLDSRSSGLGSANNITFTNPASAFTNAGTITHTGTNGGCPIIWQVTTGAAVTLYGGNIQLGTANNNTFDSVVVDGTLNLNGNQLSGSGDLTMGTTGLLIGSSTQPLASGLNSINYNGTLNLPGLPTFGGGENLTLFSATTYAGNFVSLVPTTPGDGFTWDTTSLTSTGTLIVSGGGGGGGILKIKSVKRYGTDVVLTIDAGIANANASFSVLTSANAAAPLSSWNVQATELTLDGNGTATYTNSIGGSRLFYAISLP